MNTTIQYTNVGGEPISSQQIEHLDEYAKNFFDDSGLKRSELYTYDPISAKVEFLSGKYYLSPTENLESVIADRLSEVPNWRIYFNRQSNENGDTLWSFQVFTDGNLKSQGLTAFDSQDRIIANCINENGSNNFFAKRKYFYGDPIVFEVAFIGAAALTFNYNDQTGMPATVACDFGFEMDNSYTISQFIQNEYIMADFPWEQHPYFHHFEPMLP